MSKFWENVGNRVVDFAGELRDDVRHSIDVHTAQDCAAERERNIEKATEAMLDAGLNEETVLQQLQKHWDLRRSEAEQFINWASAMLRPRIPAVVAQSATVR